MFSVVSFSQVFDHFSLAAFLLQHNLQADLPKIYLARAAYPHIKELTSYLTMACVGRTDASSEAAWKLLSGESPCMGKL